MKQLIYKAIIILIATIASILVGGINVVAEAPDVVSCSDITNDFKLYAECEVNQRWQGQWEYFNKLIHNESGWNPSAVNKSSGACGLGQALPCSKVGENWNDPYINLKWTINYIAEKYGDAKTALIFQECTGWCWYPQANEYREKENTWY